MLKTSASGVLAEHCRLTISAALTGVLCFIRHGVSLRSLSCRAEYASPLRHWALTTSRPSANVKLLIRRLADLATALLAVFLSILKFFWRQHRTGKVTV